MADQIPDSAKTIRIALEDVTPVIAAAFADNACLIWSGEHRAYWVAGGNGYTTGAAKAGRWTIADAYQQTKHCDPTKQIAFERIDATRAAPPAMDREAGELDWRLVAKLAGEHGVRYRTNRAFEQFVIAILSTLSADAIRQGEGLRALSDRATPGPWSWEQCGEKEDVPVVGIAFPGDDADCKAAYEGEFRDSDANRMTIAFDWQSCDGHSPSANAAFAVAAVNFVRKLFATPASHASDGGEA